MPKLKVESQSKHSPDETFKRIKSLLESDKELRKMDSGYTCKFDDAARTGSAKGSKFEADMKVTGAGNDCAVSIDVSLPLMLTPLKGVVQSTLQKKLEQALS